MTWEPEVEATSGVDVGGAEEVAAAWEGVEQLTGDEATSGEAE